MTNEPIAICKVVGYESNGQNFTAYVKSISLDEAVAHIRRSVPGSRITKSSVLRWVHDDQMYELPTNLNTKKGNPIDNLINQ